MYTSIRTSLALLAVQTLITSVHGIGINCDGNFVNANPDDFTGLLSLINSADFTPNVPEGGYSPTESIACLGPLCAYYIQHFGPATLDQISCNRWRTRSPSTVVIRTTAALLAKV